MIRFFLVAGGLSALLGVLARSLSSHAIRPLLEERGTLENFNLAADYLLFHALALVGVAILCDLFPEAGFQRSGIAFIVGSLTFQGSVLFKSYASMGAFGIITPIGGGILMLGWLLLMISALFAL